MLTKERAKHVHSQQLEFPYWGNYQRFMTEAEIDHVMYYFKYAKSGNVSFASIVLRIIEDRLPELQEGVPEYSEFIGMT